jgi:nucleoside-diphosphate-sugar epimerase
MQHALVTGASGFIGGHLVETLLQRGDAVRCLIRKTADEAALKEQGAEVCFGDITEPDSYASLMDGIDVVYHLAGLTSALDPADLFRVNRDGTANLIRLAAEQPKPPVFIHVSSVAAVGPAPSDRPRTNDDEPNPVSNYGRSKRAGEVAVLEFADRVPISIVRPGIVFGPRNRETLPIFKTIRQLRVHPVAGLKPPPLSLIYISDLTEILIRCAEQGKRIQPGNSTAGHYFACASEYPDYAQWGEMMKPALGRPFALTLPVVFPLPWVLAGSATVVSRLRRQATSFNIDKIREAKVASWACHDDSTSEDLQFVARASVQERTRETAEWYLQSGWL